MAYGLNGMNSSVPNWSHVTVRPELPLSGSSASSNAATAGGVSFQDLLFRSLEQVNQLDQQAQHAIESGLTTGDLTQAEIMTAVKKADLAYRTMMQVRNKVLDAYQEVQQMRM